MTDEQAVVRAAIKLGYLLEGGMVHIPFTDDRMPDDVLKFWHNIHSSHTHRLLMLAILEREGMGITYVEEWATYFTGCCQSAQRHTIKIPKAALPMTVIREFAEKEAK